MNLGLGNSLLPGDPRLIDHIVGEVKSKGIFDQFRKECIADVDTKPAYQNLRSRVETSVNGFLNKQSWRPELNKNQFRETLRKHILTAPYLDLGVERIVDQVVNPKVYSTFMPEIEDVVYMFLGMERPKRRERNGHCSLKDLLPKDLDPVSPESGPNSVKNESWDVVNEVTNEESRAHTPPPKTEPLETLKTETKKVDFAEKVEEAAPSDGNLNNSGKLEEKPEEEEEDSPSFEPIDIMNINESNWSNDSNLSGISELTSHRDQSQSPDYEYSRDHFDASNQDSQLSKVSSTSRLSIVTDVGSSNQASSSAPDAKIDDKDAKSKDGHRNFDFEAVKMKEDSQDVKSRKSKDVTDGKSKDVKESRDKNKEDPSKSKSSKSSSRDSKSHRDKDSKRRHHSSSSRSEKSRNKSSSSSKDKNEDAKDSKDSSSKSKDDKSEKKDVKDLKDIYKEKIRELREKKELTEKEKLAKVAKDSKDKRDSSRDKRDSRKDHKSSSHKSDDRSKSSKDSKNDRDKDRKDRSKKTEEKSSSESRKSSSSRKDEKKSVDNKSDKSDKHKERSSKDKRHRDDKKKQKDDHSSQRKSSSDRRSTDRDGSNGSGGKNSQNGSNGSSNSSRKSGSSNLNKESNSTSQSSSETSDGIEDAHLMPLKSSETDLEGHNTKKRTHSASFSSEEYAPNKKPKFAKNFAETNRLTKIRQQIQSEPKKHVEEYNKVQAEEVREDIAVIPDDERVQIIEVQVEEDDQSNSGDEWAMDKTVETTFLGEDFSFYRNSKDNATTKLSQINSVILDSFHEMISDKKLVERGDVMQSTSSALEEKLGESRDTSQMNVIADLKNLESHDKENKIDVEKEKQEKTLENFPETSSKRHLEVTSSPEPDCLYFNANDSKVSRKKSAYIESLKAKEIMEILGGQSDSVAKNAMAPPVIGTKRRLESPESDILRNPNNNEDLKSDSPDLSEPQLKKRRGRPKKQKSEDSGVCNSSIDNGENFIMPLSPESDVSATSEKTSSGKEDKKQQKSKQHYTSDDLYKPRPLFASSSRRNRRSNPA